MARGNWRAGKTAETVAREIDRAGTRSGARYSGRNTANITQQQLTALTTTDAGANKIFGARPNEIAAINAVGQVRQLIEHATGATSWRAAAVQALPASASWRDRQALRPVT